MLVLIPPNYLQTDFHNVYSSYVRLSVRHLFPRRVHTEKYIVHNLNRFDKNARARECVRARVNKVLQFYSRSFQPFVGQRLQNFFNFLCCFVFFQHFLACSSSDNTSFFVVFCLSRHRSFTSTIFAPTMFVFPKPSSLIPQFP